MKLNRASLDALEARYGRVLTASTQFADTRVFKPGQTATDLVLLELKTQLLFDDAIILRDTDVVNSWELLDLATKDVTFRELLTSGVCVVGLRASADCLTDVNNQAAESRADPKRHSLHRDLVAALDILMHDQDIQVLHVDEDPNRDVFSELLQKTLAKLLRSRKYSEHELLHNAVRHAELQRSEKHPKLRFGEIYRYIWGTTPPSEIQHDTELLDWCHTAHTLPVPAQLKTPISAATHDLEPEKIQALLELQPTITSVDAREVIDIYPEYVPTPLWLGNQNFADILRHRSHGEHEGYFGALAHLRETAAGDEHRFHKACREYFLCLGKYINQLKTEENGGLRGDWQLSDWKLDRVQQLSKERNAHNARLDTALKIIAVPVIASASTAMHLLPLPPHFLITDAWNFSTDSILNLTGEIAVLGGLSYQQIIRKNPFESMLGASQVRSAR